MRFVCSVPPPSLTAPSCLETLGERGAVENDRAADVSRRRVFCFFFRQHAAQSSDFLITAYEQLSACVSEVSQDLRGRRPPHVDAVGLLSRSRAAVVL